MNGNIKKLLSLVLCGTMTFSIIGCGMNPENGNKDSSSKTTFSSSSISLSEDSSSRRASSSRNSSSDKNFSSTEVSSSQTSSWSSSWEDSSESADSSDDSSGIFGGNDDSSSVEEEYDTTKSLLKIGIFQGGIGIEWLQEAVARFEAIYQDTTFEPGKKGVKIELNADKTMAGPYFQAAHIRADVYFTEGIDYYEFVNKGKVADITDIITSPMTNFNETLTIEEKLDDGMKNFLTAKDGKYYMLPYYDGFYGFIYDVDLFEKESFYFDADGDFTGSEEDKSNGPDGIDGTYDDGLPATYNQMLQLVDRIVQKNYIPFCYAGAYADYYVDRAFRGYVADYEGYEGMKLNYTLNGTAELIKEIDNNEIITETLTITPDNAYELQRQAGKYYALSMEQQLFGSTEYIGGSYNAMAVPEAQQKFITSKYKPEGRYAMLVDGVWWENEAEPIFIELENLRGEKKSDRRFGFMPIPKVSEDRVGNQTMVSLNNSYCFINAESENIDIAKEFMKFLHTDAEMSRFTRKTSVMRALSYTMSEEDRANTSYFGNTLIQMRNNANVVYPYSSEALVLNNPSAFEDKAWFDRAKLRVNYYNSPYWAFESERATVEEYFNGLYLYQREHWESLIR